MTERWVSQKRHFCEICKTWLSSHIMNVKRHEQSERHINNLRETLKSLHQRNRDKEREEAFLKNELSQMEKAASEALRADELAVAGQKAKARRSPAAAKSRALHAAAASPGGATWADLELQRQRDEKLRLQAFYEQRSGGQEEGTSSGAGAEAAGLWEFVTDQGLPFFRHRLTGEVSWTPPPDVDASCFAATSSASSAAATAAAAASAVVSAVCAAAAPPEAPPRRPVLRILSLKKPLKNEAVKAEAAPAACEPSAAASPPETLPAPPHACVKSEVETQPSSSAALPPPSAPSSPRAGGETAQDGDPKAESGRGDLPSETDEPDFVACSECPAIPKGFVFKTGELGLGLYRDRPVGGGALSGESRDALLDEKDKEKAAIIAAAAAEAAAAANSLWTTSPAPAASEEFDRRQSRFPFKRGRNGRERPAPSPGIRAAGQRAAALPASQVKDEGAQSEERQAAAAASGPSAQTVESSAENFPSSAEKAAAPSCSASAAAAPLIGSWEEVKDGAWSAFESGNNITLEDEAPSPTGESASLEGESSRLEASPAERLRHLRAVVKRRGVHHDFALSHAAEDGGDGRATKETTLHAQQRDTPEEAIPSAAAESPQFLQRSRPAALRQTGGE